MIGKKVKTQFMAGSWGKSRILLVIGKEVKAQFMAGSWGEVKGSVGNREVGKGSVYRW